MHSRRNLLFAATGLPFIPARSVSLASARFRIIRRGVDRRRYIWIHGDEVTAREVLEEHMKTADGRAFLIQNDNKRNVEIEGGQMDPNRVFSDEGAAANLKKLNPDWNPDRLNKALRRVKGDREDFLRHILPFGNGLIVALHNNGDSYSAKDEVENSDQVSLGDSAHLDEFMLCTVRADFELLSGGPFNVLWQKDKPKEDDGSLSRVCALRGSRYVNIEAARGNKAAQQRMLSWVESVLA